MSKLSFDDEQKAIDLAWATHKLGNWEIAKGLWEDLIHLLPLNPIGFIGQALTYRSCKEHLQADLVLAKGLSLFPENETLRIEYAWTSNYLDNLSEARLRWSEVRRLFPKSPQGYLGAANAEKNSGNFHFAEKLLALGHQYFPENEAIALDYAWIANLQKNWVQAKARWDFILERNPNHPSVIFGSLEAMNYLKSSDGQEVIESAPTESSSDCTQFIECRIVGDVLIGQKGNLFLANGGHAILDYVTARRKPTEISFNNFLCNIVSRQRIAAKHDAKFLHVIMADKQSVCTEDFPIANPILLGQKYLDRSHGVGHHLMYLRDRLRQSPKRSFLLTDTHLNDYGTVTAAIEIVERILGKSQERHFKLLTNEINLEREWCGDLGSKLSPPQSEKTLVNPKKWICHWFHNNLSGGNNGIIDIHINKRSIYEGRVVWFGDSFGRATCQIISYFFKEVVFFRTPFFHPELFEKIRPDFLITQNVERYLSNVDRDSDFSNFLSYPALNGESYMPSIEFEDAFSAVQNYDTPYYRDFLSKLG